MTARGRIQPISRQAKPPRNAGSSGAKKPPAAAAAAKKPAASKKPTPPPPPPKPIRPVRSKEQVIEPPQRPTRKFMTRGKPPEANKDPNKPAAPAPITPTMSITTGLPGIPGQKSYGEAPIPPRPKRGKKGQSARSTAARAAEAARAAVWAVSSEKTTQQIEAAEAELEAREVEAARVAAAEEAVRANEPATPEVQDKFTFFRVELARDDDQDDPHRVWREETQRSRHELSPGAPADEILTVQQRLGTELPPSFREFCTEWGGGRLFTQEWRELRLVGATQILTELKDRLCDRMTRPFLPLADLGDGDYLAFDTSKGTKAGEYPVVWWYGGEVKKKVAGSFLEWLEKLVAAGGEAFWWEEA